MSVRIKEIQEELNCSSKKAEEIISFENKMNEVKNGF